MAAPSAGRVCRAYLLAAQGVAEPCFLLTALLIVRGSVATTPFPLRTTRGAAAAARSIGLVAALAAPLFLLQLWFVVLTPAAFSGEGYDGAVPTYFTRTYASEPCTTGGDKDHIIAACTFPLFGTLSAAAFAACYLGAFAAVSWSMASSVINRRLRSRAYGLLAAFMVLLPVQLTLLGFTVLSRPAGGAAEALAFLAFAAVMLCTAIGEFVLVIRPVMDALAVQLPGGGGGADKGLALLKHSLHINPLADVSRATSRASFASLDDASVASKDSPQSLRGGPQLEHPETSSVGVHQQSPGSRHLRSPSGPGRLAERRASPHNAELELPEPRLL
eukprot:SM000155S01673  [mRNA]  locus=s155:320960:325389:- [translate_table: standard]